MLFQPEVEPAAYLPLNVSEEDRLMISDYDFPPGTKVEISGGRRVTKTEIDGAKGSIKEVAGQTDWQISISFYILTPSYFKTDKGKSMILELKKLRRLVEGNTPLPIINFRINSLGITKVLIERWQLPDSSQFNQPVKLECVSDNEYELILKGAENGAGGVSQ